MRKILKFATVGNSANHGSTRDYVDADAIKHMDTTDTTVIVYVIGKGANVSALDKITLTMGTAAQVQACGDKLADVLYGNKFSGRGAIMDVGVAFSAGITTIAYTAV